MQVSLTHRVIVNKLEENSFNGQIGRGEARRVLTYIFRMPKSSVPMILKELEDLKLIEIPNCRYVRIVKNCAQ